MGCGEGTLKNYHDWNRLFIRWCGRNGLRSWKEIDWDHLQQYANELARKGLSKRSIQAYTFPVRSASEKAAHKWRDTFHDFAKGYSAPQNAKGKRKQHARKIDWVCRFLLWLRNHPAGWGVITGVALQGLCGLRVTEVLRLTWDRVDLVHGLIWICNQTTKNEQSIRTIPIPRLVLEILRAAPRNGDRVVHAYSTIGSWRNVLAGRKVKKGKPKQVVYLPGFMDNFETGSSIPPKDLRNTLASERRKRLWNKEVMELYYGHEGKKVIDEHYTHLEDDELMEIFRREVVEKVDEVVAPHLERWRTETQKVVQ